MLRILLLLVISLSIVGCQTPAQRSKAKKKTDEKAHTIKDANGDVDFQAFVGRLRIAATRHDMQTMASVMTPGFGFNFNQKPSDNVFQYWDQNNVWSQVNRVLHQPFAPKGNFMVAPASFVSHPDTFHGYRAGIMLVNGAWKFAYFVTDAPTPVPVPLPGTDTSAPSPTPAAAQGGAL